MYGRLLSLMWSRLRSETKDRMQKPGNPTLGWKDILWLISFTLLAGGCSTLGTDSTASRIGQLPMAARDSVYPFFINSPLDLPQLGRLSQVASFFQDNGFRHSTLLFRSSGDNLAGRILDLRQRDPDARIALIGWSGASLWIWDALKLLEESDTRIDLIVYLDSNWIKRRVSDRGHPDNFYRAVLIYRRNNPPVAGVPNSVIRRAGTGNHLAVAAHSDTIRTLEEELIRLASY